MFKITQLSVLVVILTFIIGCKTADKPVKNQAQDLNWPTSTPASEGIDPLELDAIHQDIQNGKYGLIDHFLVIAPWEGRR